MKKLVIKSIEKYQKNGGGTRLLRIDCCFSPTCSEYTKQAIQKFGLVKGGLLGTQRIFRCREYGSPFICLDPVE